MHFFIGIIVGYVFADAIGNVVDLATPDQQEVS